MWKFLSAGPRIQPKFTRHFSSLEVGSGHETIILIDAHDVRLLEFHQDNPFGLNLRTRTMTTERARKMGGGRRQPLESPRFLRHCQVCVYVHISCEHVHVNVHVNVVCVCVCVHACACMNDCWHVQFTVCSSKMWLMYYFCPNKMFPV